MKTLQRTKSQRRMIRTMRATILAMLLTFLFPDHARAQGSTSVDVKPIDGRVNAKSVDTNVDPNGSQPAPAVPKGQIDGYLIGPDDVLTVYIMDVPELSRDYRVESNGSVTIPMLSKPLTAAGLTLSQFSDRLSSELKTAGLVSDPHITTSITQSRLHAVAITGAVKKPQVYPVFTHTTLLDLLSQAEGLSDDAGNTAIVRRGDVAIHALGLDNKTSTPGQPDPSQSVTVDLKQLLESGDAHSNVDVYPGDRVTVTRAAIVYVVGAVNKPGGFAMRASSHGMTVLQAIALAEDTKGTAKRDQSLIIRNDAQSPEGRKQIPVDLKKILSGKSSDPVLQAEDILFVPDSSGKRALHRGLESVLQAVTGVTIYSARF
jgi:polysaccharide export outer membrane protein